MNSASATSPYTSLFSHSVLHCTARHYRLWHCPARNLTTILTLSLALHSTSLPLALHSSYINLILQSQAVLVLHTSILH
eukprot:scaffold143247_cov27-Tisochrysis_lutea.AAC.1